MQIRTIMIRSAKRNKAKLKRGSNDQIFLAIKMFPLQKSQPQPVQTPLRNILKSLHRVQNKI